MYPGLLAPLLTLSAVLLAGLLFVALRQPVSRRLALRQLARRPSEAALAVIGSTLGTAIIVGALVVGDTLNFSVRQSAYQTLGPIDERVISSDVRTGDMVATRLANLTENPNVDGVLSAHVAQAAAVHFHGGLATAEPRVLVWDMDLDEAGRFGSAAGDSGLHGPRPGEGQMVINQPLADSLKAKAGDEVTIFVFGSIHRLLVERIVPERGVAGTGLGGSQNRNAFLAPGVIEADARAARTSPRGITFVSNTGGVEGGAARTATVTAAIRSALGPDGKSALVDTPKKDVLKAAKTTGDSLGAVFLMIGSFSIIAGALLLVNIFVMLAEERKSQLGMLRAIGMRRSRLIGSFALEGACYALASIVPGLLIGLGVGWAVALVAAEIFRSFSAGGEGLTIAFAVTPTSLVNAAALGLVIGLLTIIGTSVRISRFNVIAAIRDLPPTTTARARRLTLVVSTVLAVVFGLAAVPAVAASQPESTYLLPSLAGFFCIPALRRVIGSQKAVTIAAGAITVWCLVAPVARPHLFDDASMAVYVIEGTLLAFSAVALVSQNQDALLRPVRALFERPSEGGLALRLAVAYPLAKRFRTGATLVMYTLITLVLVLLVEITGIVNASVDKSVRDATAGYAMRIDLNPERAQLTIDGLRAGAFGNEVSTVTPLLTAPALAADPGKRTTQPVRSVVVGVPANSLSSMPFTARLDGLSTDAAVWAALAADRRYVALDQFFGSAGGPGGSYFSPGDTFAVTDPRTGRTEQKIIVGVLANAYAFYPTGGEAGSAFPFVTSEAAVRDQFGDGATQSAALLRIRPGVDPQDLASRIQARYLEASLVATPMAASVRRMFSANIAFFRLMEGFLALGLFVGITGLGVVMVRAVRERRRTIGVLRALGFRAATVQRSFLLESGIVALEGVLLGGVLGVLTTWLMYQKSAAFETTDVAFPIEWTWIVPLALATLLASVAATVAPARRAAQIRPAVAVRIAD